MSSPHSYAGSGRFQLPQHLPADLRQVRLVALARDRRDFAWRQDPGIAENSPAHLPPYLAPWAGASGVRRALAWLKERLPPKDLWFSEIPPRARFLGPKFFRHGTHAGSMKLRIAYVRLSNVDFRPTSEDAYRRILGTIPPPRAVADWRADTSFARQRLIGVNPMAIRRLTGTPSPSLLAAADQVLRARHGTSFAHASERGTLYCTDYPLLWEPQVRAEIRPGADLAAPTVLFHVDERGTLWPLAIQLKPPSIGERNPVFTPLDGVGDWLLARAHAQAADSHYHEAIYHLLETHLVTEVFAVATQRQLHESHPLRHLLAGHFENTLAINEQARRNLLAAHGEIAHCMTAKHTGAVQLARLGYADWSFSKRRLHADLASREVMDIPGYFYRDDALAIWDIIHAYVTEILEVWYRDDLDVHDDPELAAWSEEIADPMRGGMRDFPSRITTRVELARLVADIIFRGSAQHAAVNNGQFGAYGWIPNAPVAVFAPLPELRPGEGRPPLSEAEFFRALPDREHTFGQTGMVWLLSEPTERSLLRAGESEAFRPEHSPAASEAVGRFRQRLRARSDAITRRNQEAGVEYNYLKPQNIDRSIAI